MTHRVILQGGMQMAAVKQLHLIQALNDLVISARSRDCISDLGSFSEEANQTKIHDTLGTNPGQSRLANK